MDKIADPFYSARPWQKLRAAILRERGRICSVPGCPKEGKHVDHIKSRRRHPELELDPDNLQILCAGHHTTKGIQVDGLWGKPIGGVQRLFTKGCDNDGMPLDPRHLWHKSRLRGE